MPVTVSVTELKQRTAQVLNRAIVQREDVIFERYGREQAVILSRERYQELIDAARARLRERFLAAEREVHESTRDVAPEEISGIVNDAIQDSRRQRAGVDASDH